MLYESSLEVLALAKMNISRPSLYTPVLVSLCTKDCSVFAWVLQIAFEMLSRWDERITREFLSRILLRRCNSFLIWTIRTSQIFAVSELITANNVLVLVAVAESKVPLVSFVEHILDDMTSSWYCPRLEGYSCLEIWKKKCGSLADDWYVDESAKQIPRVYCVQEGWGGSWKWHQPKSYCHERQTPYHEKWSRKASRVGAKCKIFIHSLKSWLLAAPVQRSFSSL